MSSVMKWNGLDIPIPGGLNKEAQLSFSNWLDIQNPEQVFQTEPNQIWSAYLQFLSKQPPLPKIDPQTGQMQEEAVEKVGTFNYVPKVKTRTAPELRAQVELAGELEAVFGKTLKKGESRKISVSEAKRRTDAAKERKRDVEGYVNALSDQTREKAKYLINAIRVALNDDVKVVTGKNQLLRLVNATINNKTGTYFGIRDIQKQVMKDKTLKQRTKLILIAALQGARAINLVNAAAHRVLTLQRYTETELENKKIRGAKRALKRKVLIKGPEGYNKGMSEQKGQEIGAALVQASQNKAVSVAEEQIKDAKKAPDNNANAFQGSGQPVK